METAILAETVIYYNLIIETSVKMEYYQHIQTAGLFAYINRRHDGQT